jgi:hypothetical protein
VRELTRKMVNDDLHPRQLGVVRKNRAHDR